MKYSKIPDKLVVRLTKKEAANLKESDVVPFVVMLSNKLEKKYPKLEFTGQWEICESKQKTVIIFFRK